jgi:hypothetical protein
MLVYTRLETDRALLSDKSRPSGIKFTIFYKEPYACIAARCRSHQLFWEKFKTGLLYQAVGVASSHDMYVALICSD